MKIEVNATTGEVLERELTTDELNQEALDHASVAEIEAVKLASEAEKADAKVALLERLGITEDEAKLLLG
jgi:uncharacterized membrane protein YkoI